MDLKGHSYSGAGSAALPCLACGRARLVLLPSVGLRVWPPAARPGCCAVVLVSGDAGILLVARPSVDGLAQAIDWYHFSFQVYVLHQLCQLGLCGQFLQKRVFKLYRCAELRHSQLYIS